MSSKYAPVQSVRSELSNLTTAVVLLVSTGTMAVESIDALELEACADAGTMLNAAGAWSSEPAVSAVELAIGLAVVSACSRARSSYNRKCFSPKMCTFRYLGLFQLRPSHTTHMHIRP